MKTLNYEMVQEVAHALEELNEEIVYNGGAVTEIYSSRINLDEIRLTIDVDVVIEVSSRIAYADMENKIRSKGFKNDFSKGSPVCRWKLNSIIIDIMPNDRSILGFTNIWHSEGFKNTFDARLENGRIIHLFKAE